jgi:amidohydrolase
MIRYIYKYRCTEKQNFAAAIAEGFQLAIVMSSTAHRRWHSRECHLHRAINADDLQGAAMFLTQEELTHINAFRRELHRHPEVSGEEAETARRVREALLLAKPDRIVSNLGGHGVAAVYEGAIPGPTVMIRAELDGLPIEELSDLAYRSTVSGKGHLCGHDGHMSILMALATALGQKRPTKGRVVLLFQPAEENGAGAAAVLADPEFATLKPDMALSLHNFPGIRLGHVLLRDGPVNCASRGMKIVLKGKTSHASYPGRWHCADDSRRVCSPD